jgi:hypothetical protein
LYRLQQAPLIGATIAISGVRMIWAGRRRRD